MFCFSFTVFFLLAGAAAFRAVPHANVSAFRRVGSLLDGAVHAHLAISFNVTDEVRVAEDLLRASEFASANSSALLWVPFLARLKPEVKDWQDFADMVERLSKKPNSPDARPKRQALAAAAVVGAAGVGAWSIYETTQLSKRVDAVDGKVDHLCSAVKSAVDTEKHTLGAISSIRAALANVSNDLTGLEKFTMAYEDADLVLNRLIRRKTGLKALLQQSLSPELLEDRELEKALATLRRRVMGAGFELASDNLLQLFSQQVSFIVEYGMIKMMLHLPARPAEARSAALYQHLPLPIELNNSMAVVTGRASFLAVFEDDHSFAEVSDADLSSCYRQEQDFFCAAAFPRHRGGMHACLTALFTELVDRATQVCDVVPLEQDLAVFRLNSTAFVLASSTEHELDVRCGFGAKESVIKASGVSVISLESGCTATSEAIVFEARVAHMPEDLHVVIQGPSLKYVNDSISAALDFRVTNVSVSEAKAAEAGLVHAEAELEAAEDTVGLGEATSWPGWVPSLVSGSLPVALVIVGLVCASARVRHALRCLCPHHGGVAAATQAADAVARCVTSSGLDGAARAPAAVAAAGPSFPAPAPPVCVTVNNNNDVHGLSLAGLEESQRAAGRAAREAASASPGGGPASEPVAFYLC